MKGNLIKPHRHVDSTYDDSLTQGRVVSKVDMRAVWVVAVGLISSPVTLADENLWIYAKGTDTLPKGELEFELNDIIREGKNSGDYRFHDIRPEIEYGVSNSITLSFEALIFSHDYAVADPELNPMYETQTDAGGRFNKTQFAGYEISMTHNLLSPYKDEVGLSYSLGYERREKYRLDGADIDQDSFVTALLLQKDFLDDTLIWVFNLKAEFERRKSPGVLEEEIAFDWATAVSYRVAANWYAGIELRHQSDYLNPQEDGEFNPELRRSSFDLTDFRIGSRHQYGMYFGPTLHYGDKEWWFTAGILWQVKGGGSQFAYISHGRNWDEHEERHIGLSFGLEFD
jgi:hypothetical protein